MCTHAPTYLGICVVTVVSGTGGKWYWERIISAVDTSVLRAGCELKKSLKRHGTTPPVNGHIHSHLFGPGTPALVFQCVYYCST
jgi:hypothetical protein